jgi:hypothetical protein
MNFAAVAKFVACPRFAQMQYFAETGDVRLPSGKQRRYKSDMNRSARTSLLVLFCAAFTAKADVTIRYKSDVQLASFLPPEIFDQFNKSLKPGLDAAVQTIRMKDGKAASLTGNFSCLVDFNKQELSLLDGENKRVAIVPAAKFNESWAGSMPQIPEQARKMFESMKVDFQSRLTGQSEVIQGVQAEEREFVLSMEMPVPGEEEAIPAMKLVMRIWTAKPEEALRVQAIRELTAYNLWTSFVMNPVQGMGKIFSYMPGFGEGMNRMMAELSKSKTVMLRTETKLYSSFFVQLAQRMQQQGKPLPEGFDPDSPLVDVTQNVAELSTAPLEDAVFQVPEGYQRAPIADLMQALTKPKLLP